MANMQREDLTDPNAAEVHARALKYDYLRPRASEALVARVQSSVSDPPPPRNGRFYQGPKELASGPWRTLSLEEAQSKSAGAMLGLAIGDALGATLEFKPRDSSHVEDIVGGGPFHLKPGEWTDDTTMALCLADSLLEQHDFNPRSFAQHLIEWYQHGKNSVNGICFDIGATTKAALDSFLATGLTGRGPAGFRSAGNGGLVRVAPIVIYHRKSFAQTWTMAKAQSVVTHAAIEAVSATQFFAAKLWDALNGATKVEVLEPRVLPVTDRVLLINAGEYKSKSRDQISSSGYAIDTLEAALWSVWTTERFEDAVLTAANLGDDSDSVAALAGQLAGALYGIDAIPQRWIERLAWQQELSRKALALFQESEKSANSA